MLEWLSKQGYGVISKVKTTSEHGEDIKVKKVRSQNYFIVECNGDSSEKGRQVNFVSALGEIVQRVKHERHYRYALAFPESYSDLVYRRIPWVAAKKLGLEVLLVDVKGKVDRITWRNLKEVQAKKD